MPWADPTVTALRSGMSHLASVRNRARHHSHGRDWATPPEIFEPLDAEFRFTLDPCATPASAKCARYFTEQEDGLSQSWQGQIVFMNPPYGAELPRWTAKARSEAQNGTTVVGLLPAATDTLWWHRDVIDHAEVRYIRGRVRFITSTGGFNSPFQPVLLVVWKGQS